MASGTRHTTVRLGRVAWNWMADLKVQPGLEEATNTEIIRAALIVAQRHQAETIETIRERL